MTIEIIQSKEQNEERIKKNEQSLRDLWDTVKCTNTHITESQRRRKRWQKKTFEEIMAEGTSLVVRWLRLHASTAGGSGSIPGQGTFFLVWPKKTKKKGRKNGWGLLWWRSGWESACQCRGHGFKPWSGKIPHAVEQVSPCATTRACALEPVSHNYWARVPQLLKPAHLEPVLHNERSHRNEKLMHCNEE